MPGIERFPFGFADGQELLRAIAASPRRTSRLHGPRNELLPKRGHEVSRKLGQAPRLEAAPLDEPYQLDQAWIGFYLLGQRRTLKVQRWQAFPQPILAG